MILFDPGPPTPPLHRRHPAVRHLDRLIRGEQAYLRWRHALAYTTPEMRARVENLQHLREQLVGKKLRGYPRQGRLAL